MISSRKLHRSLSWIVGIPLFVMILTGVSIQLKAWLPYLQPELHSSTQIENAATRLWTIDEFYQISRAHAPEHVQTPENIRAIDIRPKAGVARIRTQDHFEIQIDLGTGQFIQAKPRFVGWIIALHEGTLFGKWIRFGLWVPIAILSLVLSISGFFILLRRRRYERV